GRWNRVFEPHPFAGRGIKRRNPVADSGAAIGRADDDLVLDGERRRRDNDTCDIGKRSLPNDLAGFLVGGDNAPRTVTGGYDKISPQCDSAALALLLLLRIHAPNNTTD